jgi:hypothetical protein
VTTTPADELRGAAEKLRSLATDATPGPWRQHDTHLGQYGYAATVLSGEGNDTDLRAWLPSMSQEPWDETRNVWPDAQYIAAMHPGVGAALAELLETAAEYVADDSPTHPTHLVRALAVARAIND